MKGNGKQGRVKSGGKKRPITVRQRKLVQNVLKGQTLKDAAIAAGYTPLTADARGTKLINAEYWAEVLKRCGLTDEDLGNGIKDLMRANSTKFFAHEGMVVDKRDVKDWDARHNGLQLYAKIRRALPTIREEAQGSGPGPVVHVEFLIAALNAPQGGGNGQGESLTGVSFRVATRRDGDPPARR